MPPLPLPSLLTLATALALTTPALAAPGDLDGNFGSAGTMTAAFTAGDDFGNAVALQTDQKILIAGESNAGDFALLRLNTNGSVDTNFGSGGKFTQSFGIFESARGVAVQSSKKIIVGGAGLVVSRDFAVMRCLENGTLDTSFGTGGVTTTDIQSGFNDQVYAMALQTNDRIILAGSYRTNVALVRYLADGALDPGFGTGGKVFNPATTTTEEVANAVVVQGDDRIVIAGYSRTGSNTDFLVARYLSTGAPDTTFGTGGKVIAPVGLGNTSDVANSVVVLSSGKILVAGTSGGDFAMMRFTNTGVLDTTFAIGGGITIDFTGATDAGYGLAVQPDGKILLTGTSNTGGRDYFAILRFTAAGALDTAFNTNGGNLVAVTAGSDSARCIALQNDGRIVVAGSGGLAGNKDFAVARYESAGVQTLAEWRQLYFGTTANSGNAADNFDFDKDGVVNLLEYSFGLNPTDRSSHQLPLPQRTGGNFVTAFATPGTVTGVTYTAEWSTSLTAGTWTVIPNTGTGSQHLFSVPTAGKVKLFTRLKVAVP